MPTRVTQGPKIDIGAILGAIDQSKSTKRGLDLQAGALDLTRTRDEEERRRKTLEDQGLSDLNEAILSARKLGMPLDEFLSKNAALSSVIENRPFGDTVDERYSSVLRSAIGNSTGLANARQQQLTLNALTQPGFQSNVDKATLFKLLGDSSIKLRQGEDQVFAAPFAPGGFGRGPSVSTQESQVPMKNPITGELMRDASGNVIYTGQTTKSTTVSPAQLFFGNIPQEDIDRTIAMRNEREADEALQQALMSAFGINRSLFPSGFGPAPPKPPLRTNPDPDIFKKLFSR
jgi:hypothetical protein